MAVTLNIVGIFFTQSFDFSEVKGNKSVESLLDLAVSKNFSVKPPFGFAFNFQYSKVVVKDQGKDKSIVNSLGFDHKSGFKSRSGTSYPPGLYKLFQTFNGEDVAQYNVWQYYIFDSDMKRVKVQGETSYTDEVVKDGYTVVWRLVSVCNRPVSQPKRFDKLMNRDADAAPQA